MCQHLKGAPPDRYAFANVHTALVSEQVTATPCLSCANVTFPLHTELVLTQAQSQSSAVSGQALIPSLAPSTDQTGRRQRTRAAVYSWRHTTRLAIFKILETVLLFHRKALPGPLVVLRIPKVTVKLEPILSGKWQSPQRLCTEPHVPSFTPKSRFCHYFLLPQERNVLNPWEAATPLRLSFNCREATCESDIV